jgi:ribosome maturation factor RimP
MSHPIIPQVLELAAPVAAFLGLEVVSVMYYTHQSPPVLRIDIRNLQQDTGLEDCERMSRALEPVLDESDLFPDAAAYALEVSSPGVPGILETDREFVSFKGFPVLVTADTPHDGQTSWQGNLVGRDEALVRLTLKGRPIGIPRTLITSVQLVDADEE